MTTQKLKHVEHPQIDDALISKIVHTIVDAFNPRRIILFGSHAEGKARPDSDLDLFIEMETNLHPAERRTRVRRLFWPQTCAMDILVYTPQEVAERRDVLGTLVYSVERRGRTLYERPEK